MKSEIDGQKLLTFLFTVGMFACTVLYLITRQSVCNVNVFFFFSTEVILIFFLCM